MAKLNKISTSPDQEPDQLSIFDFNSGLDSFEPSASAQLNEQRSAATISQQPAADSINKANATISTVAESKSEAEPANPSISESIGKSTSESTDASLNWSKSEPGSESKSEFKDQSTNQPSSEITSDILLDLSNQQRNLLLMHPLFDLEQGKRSVTDSEGNVGVMAEIDTHYLSLALLDFLMEGVAIGSGQYPSEVIKYLIALLTAMSPDMLDSDKRKIAEHVLGHIANARENYKEFAREYFDAKTKRRQTYRFKLITFEPDLEENYLYKPTEEGYLVYLGMLDLSPEDSAELMEKMLGLLIKRNKFAQAVDIAKRARALSIEYRQIIRDTITRARRTPRAVNWLGEIQPRLDKARGHVRERRKEDGAMMLSVHTSLAATDELEVRQKIVQLVDILQSASNLRSKLHSEIMMAPDQYLQAQSLVFRVRGPSNLPSLEEILFPQMMTLSVSLIAQQSDALAAAMYPPKFPHIFELNTVFALLLDKRARPIPLPEEEGEFTTEIIVHEVFSAEEISKAESWIREKLQALSSETPVEELLIMAEQDKLPRSSILCIALFLYVAMHESSQFKDIETKFINRTFRTDFVRGKSLTLTRRGKQ